MSSWASDDFDELSRRTPLLANIRPAGKYLMEDFFYAGGLPALLAQLGDLLDTSAVTANGQTLGENIADAKVFDDDVIRSRDNPLVDVGHAGDAVRQPRPGRRGDQAARPRRPACTATAGPRWCSPTTTTWPPGSTTPTWSSTRTRSSCCRTRDRKGAPGMPEWGQLPIPKKLLEHGVRDMVRISDARMSGTSYGACVLHVAPESAVGGPLALVRDGDLIELDVAARRLVLHVDDDELDKRRVDWQPPAPKYGRGYGALYLQHITQANEGCDFDFLEAGPPTPEPEIH